MSQSSTFFSLSAHFCMISVAGAGGGITVIANLSPALWKETYVNSFLLLFLVWFVLVHFISEK